MACAAEESRLRGQTIDLAEYEKNLRTGADHDTRFV
jgi:hypothetical protein